MYKPNVIDRFLHERQGAVDAAVERRVVGRDGIKPCLILLRCRAEGATQTIERFVHTPLSATVVIARNGDILRTVPETDGPLAFTGVVDPTPRAEAALAAAPDNVNAATLAIELVEAEPGLDLSARQVLSAVDQVRAWMTTYGIPLDRVLCEAEVTAATACSHPSLCSLIVTQCEVPEAEGAIIPLTSAVRTVGGAGALAGSALDAILPLTPEETSI